VFFSCSSSSLCFFFPLVSTCLSKDSLVFLASTRLTLRVSIASLNWGPMLDFKIFWVTAWYFSFWGALSVILLVKTTRFFFDHGVIKVEILFDLNVSFQIIFTSFGTVLESISCLPLDAFSYCLFLVGVFFVGVSPSLSRLIQMGLCTRLLLFLLLSLH
jgi:hypothetical protein